MDLNFTDQEIREDKESILSALTVSMASKKSQRDVLNRDLRKLRAYKKRIEGK